MKIILIRHGQSEGNLDRNIYKTTPDNKVGLTGLGIAQAANKGFELANSEIQKCITMYHSSWKRAKDTSILIQRAFDFQLQNIECPLLHEQIYYSNLEDGALAPYIPYTDTVATNFGAFWYQKSDTKIETFASVYHRALTFWNHLRISHKNKETIIVVAHGHFLKVLEMVIKQLSIDEFEKLPDFYNCESRVINYDKKTNTTE